jgi:hypothetical protein
MKISESKDSLIEFLSEVILIDEPTTSQSSKNDKAEADVTELLENEEINLDGYHKYLRNEKDKFLKEKQNENKLSNTIENYMIEDAMVA